MACSKTPELLLIDQAVLQERVRTLIYVCACGIIQTRHMVNDDDDDGCYDDVTDGTHL